MYLQTLQLRDDKYTVICFFVDKLVVLTMQEDHVSFISVYVGNEP